jgi:hypothetical protein
VTVSKTSTKQSDLNFKLPHVIMSTWRNQIPFRNSKTSLIVSPPGNTHSRAFSWQMKQSLWKISLSFCPHFSPSQASFIEAEKSQQQIFTLSSPSSHFSFPLCLLPSHPGQVSYTKRQPCGHLVKSEFTNYKNPRLSGPRRKGIKCNYPEQHPRGPKRASTQQVENEEVKPDLRAGAWLPPSSRGSL